MAHTDCPVIETFWRMEFERAKSAVIFESIDWWEVKEIPWISLNAFDTKVSLELVTLARDRKTDVAIWEVSEEGMRISSYM